MVSCWVNMVADLLCHTWTKRAKIPGTDLNAYLPTFFPIQEVIPIGCGPKRQVTSYKTSVGMCWANMVGLLCPHLDSTESPERVELPGTDGHAYSPYTSEPVHTVLYHYHTIKTHAILLTVVGWSPLWMDPQPTFLADVATILLHTKHQESDCPGSILQCED